MNKLLIFSTKKNFSRYDFPFQEFFWENFGCRNFSVRIFSCRIFFPSFQDFFLEGFWDPEIFLLEIFDPKMFILGPVIFFRRIIFHSRNLFRENFGSRNFSWKFLTVGIFSLSSRIFPGIIFDCRNFSLALRIFSCWNFRLREFFFWKF